MTQEEQIDLFNILFDYDKFQKLSQFEVDKIFQEFDNNERLFVFSRWFRKKSGLSPLFREDHKVCQLLGQYYTLYELMINDPEKVRLIVNNYVKSRLQEINDSLLDILKDETNEELRRKIINQLENNVKIINIQ